MSGFSISLCRVRNYVFVSALWHAGGCMQVGREPMTFSPSGAEIRQLR